MTPYYEREGITLYLGNCLDVMAGMAENSVDSIITDPPYGLEFMGKDWDKLEGAGVEQTRDSAGGFLRNGKSGSNPYAAVRIRHGKDKRAMQEWHYKWAIEALRVAKPGALLLAFGGTRTYHRLACAIEDAGWLIRDCIMWVYGSGFPKSHDISKAIDKMAGAEREVVGQKRGSVHDGGPTLNQLSRPGKSDSAAARCVGAYGTGASSKSGQVPITAPATPAAKLWDGYGTALKPAYEPIIVAMKPLDGTFAANALAHGVAGLWVDGGRVGTEEISQHGRNHKDGGGWKDHWHNELEKGKKWTGRFPANLILTYPNDAHDADGNLLPNPEKDEVVGLFPVTKSGAKHGVYSGWGTGREIYGGSNPYLQHCEASEGSAARFFKHCPPDAKRVFYAAKASRAERNKGLEGMEERQRCSNGFRNPTNNPMVDRIHGLTKRKNHHPTVKPLSLMRYLCRITRPPTGGVVVDPFMGSGTTGAACVWTDRDFIGIDTSADYCEIAKRRVDAALDEPKQARLL